MQSCTDGQVDPRPESVEPRRPAGLLSPAKAVNQGLRWAAGLTTTRGREGEGRQWLCAD